MARRNLLFVTGTDTGVGKTLLTGLLLRHLRSRGRRALAVKPFCSGSRRDVEVLQRFQEHELTDEEVSPFFRSEPVAPYAAALESGRRSVRLFEARRHIERMADRAELLLVEGAGGLLVPLGRGFAVIDLIQALDGPVVLVARDKLGTINHTLLSLHALKERGVSDVRVVLMGQRKPDPSVRTNGRVLKELASRVLRRVTVSSIGHLGANPLRPVTLRRREAGLSGVLEEILRGDAIAGPGRRRSGRLSAGLPSSRIG